MRFTDSPSGRWLALATCTETVGAIGSDRERNRSSSGSAPIRFDADEAVDVVSPVATPGRAHSQRDQLAGVRDALRRACLALARMPRAEDERSLDRAQLRVADHDLEQDLEAAGSQPSEVEGRLVDEEEAGHRIAHVSEPPSERERAAAVQSEDTALRARPARPSFEPVGW